MTSRQLYGTFFPNRRHDSVDMPIHIICIIKLITWAMVHLIGMWWPPHESIPAALHAATFLSLAVSTLYFFLQSLLEGPGFVPLGWRPDNELDITKLQYCATCKGYKAPRSHHCKQCGYCVMKMDHHCPWINCCVGHSNHGYFTLFLISAVLGCLHASIVSGYCVMKMDHHCPWINCCVGHSNHGYFTLFLISAVLGCLHASIVLSICVYHAINRVWYLHNGTGQEPIVYLTLTTLLLTLLAVGMAVGVVLAVGTLLCLQIRGILRNRTTIEDWIMEKAVNRREEQGLPAFVFPYDLGWRCNLRFLLNSHRYDGLHWPLRIGCGQYDLTMEQIAQKEEKRQRSRLFVAAEGYGGQWVPLRRPRAALSAPCSAEPRLTLRPGDLIRATRQRRHWLFGELVVNEARGPRGWFPSAVAVPADARAHMLARASDHEHAHEHAHTHAKPD
ncbi:putative palmitoyltransferase ZDHHC6 [Papilio machaon]|uniref:Palmitoyltransferase n=1 Tax=Papilio machaon TaxID=76193 RepID=A0A0N0PBY0_PAPMA|nr:putative palmitoyltransferase ZDHHC6 [Papilio machaon]